MVPYDHARLHARDFGGVPEDYLPVDEFLDATKLHCADHRHRAILHSSFGMDVCERVFGPAIVNSDGQPIAVREIARRHIMEDCGVVPTVKEWLDALTAGMPELRKFNISSRAAKKWLEANPVTPQPVKRLAGEPITMRARARRWLTLIGVRS